MKLYKFCSLVLLFHATSKGDPVHFNQAAVNLGKRFHQWSDNILNASGIQAKIDKEVHLVDAFNGADKLKQIADRLSSYFATTLVVVDRLKKTLLSIYEEKNFQAYGNECCKFNETHFDYSRNDEVSSYSCNTRSAASPNMTMINWSQLNQTAQQNLVDSPSLTWQYYGSEEGTATFFPGVQSDRCFDYDPRYRPWYVETATTPKDLVILLDRSLSMDAHNAYQLARNAATMVINTLNPNDRISLVAFSTDVYTPSLGYKTCYEHQMAFATPQVKQYFASYLDELEVTGTANYTKAFSKAFDLLGTGDRDQGILLLTDGQDVTSEDKEQILKLLADSQVLLLIYDFDVGPGKDVLQEMAKTGAGESRPGHYEEIQNDGQLRSKLVHYYSEFTAKTSTAPTVTVPYTDFYNLEHIFSVCRHIKVQGILKGVTCIDRSLDDLRATFNLVQDDSVYAFIIDNTGRTLVHPLLPQPGPEPRSDPLFVNINVLEPEAERSGIIRSMLNSIELNRLDPSPSNKTIERALVSSSGNTRYGDFRGRIVTASYYWKWVYGTKFAVCLVMTNESKNFSMRNQELHPEEFHYHLSDVEPTCVHNGEQVTTEHATVSIETSSYIKETRSYINLMTNYMTGKHDLDFKEDIRPTLALLEDHTDKWKDSFETPMKQLYIRTYNGIMVTYPGIPKNRKTTHLDLVWYRKSHVTSGSMYVIRRNDQITLAQPISKRLHNAEKIWAVVAMDVSASLLMHLMETTVLECSWNDKYSCIVMDENGGIIWHPDIDSQQDSSGALSIHKAEPDIGQFLIKSGILVPNACTDYSWKKTYHTWKVSDTAVPTLPSELNVYPFFFFTPITNSNLYFIMKNKENATDYKACLSCSKPYKCKDLQECYCPCSSELDYQQCTGKFLQHEDDAIYPPCVQQWEHSIPYGPQSVSSPSKPHGPSCSGHTECAGKVEEWRCMLYSECVWCRTGSSATNATSYMCMSVTQCQPEPDIHSKEEPSDDVRCPNQTCIGAILLSVFITMVATLLISLVIWKYLDFSEIKKFCFSSKVMVQSSEDPYLNIGNVKRARNQTVTSDYLTTRDDIRSSNIAEAEINGQVTSVDQLTYMDIMATPVDHEIQV